MANVTVQIEIAGEVVDTATAAMPDEALLLTIDAVAAAYGWTETIPNPTFDPNQPASEANPKSVPNMTKARHFSFRLRKFAEDHAFAYAKELARQRAAQQAEATVKALADAVTVS